MTDIWPGRRDAEQPLPEDRQRRDGAARAHHRRPARPRASRGRRRHVEAGAGVGRRRSSSACSTATSRPAGRRTSGSSCQSPPAPGRSRATPNRLEQALQNLAANAVRHTPEGGRITLSADSRRRRVCASSSKTAGTGIPPEHLPRVFDRFYKVDVSRTGTTLPSGSGLGLSIVQAIVERHGGTITASNVDGGGARFEIVLPTTETRPAEAGETIADAA